MKPTKKIKLTPEQRAAELATCAVVAPVMNEFAGMFNATATEEFVADPVSIRLRAGDIIRYDGSPHIVTRSSEAGAKIMPMTRKTEKWVTKLTGKPVEFTKRPTGHNISRALERSWFISRGGEQALEDFLNGKHQPVTDSQQQNPDARKQRNNMKALNEDTAIATEIAPGPYDSKPAPALKKVKPAAKSKKDAKAKTPVKGKKAAAKPAKKTDGAPVVRSEQKGYIWSQLDGSKTKKEICAAVVKKFGTDAETAAKRINDAPFYMRKAGLKPAWKA